jgi:hypothetical protein
VKLPFPKFQKGDADHDELSALGRSCAELAGNFVKGTEIQDLEPRALGSVRARRKTTNRKAKRPSVERSW